MAIDLNSNAANNFKSISKEAILNEIRSLLIGDEEVVMAFQAVRDHLVFTNRRIISITLDGQGLAGRRRSFVTIPYSRIEYFSIEAPGIAELFPDSELVLVLRNGTTVKYSFKGSVDIARLGKAISEYILE